MKNSCSPRAPWHNLHHLGTFLLFSWSEWHWLYRIRTCAESEGIVPDSTWPARQLLAFVQGSTVTAQLSPFAKCFLSKSSVTNVAEKEGCWASGRPSFIKEKVTPGMRQQNPFSTTSFFSWPPLPAYIGNHDAWNHSSLLRTMRQPALG